MLEDFYFDRSGGVEKLCSDESWARILEIMDDASDCYRLGGHEANWLDKVVQPVVEMALRQDDLHETLDLESV